MANLALRHLSIFQMKEFLKLSLSGVPFSNYDISNNAYIFKAQFQHRVYEMESCNGVVELS